jgi:hypothetical protein
MVAFPNPEMDEIHFDQVTEGCRHLGDLRAAATVAGVKPSTIKVWVSRGKIEPVPVSDGEAVFHLPTVKAAAEARSKYTPTNPAANSRRPHRRGQLVAA